MAEQPSAAAPGTPGSFRKKVFFFHVPKTAGSTFNKVLKQTLPGGQTHAEALLPPGEALRLSDVDRLRTLDFVSGHIPFPAFEASGFNRHEYLQAIILREPIAQLVSHINWMLRIREIGGFEGHSDWIRRISDDVASADLSQPVPFIDLLLRHRMLFQNVQTRMLANSDGVSSPFNALANLARLDLVGVTEQFQEFLNRFFAITGLPRPAAPLSERENVNPSYRLTLGWVRQTPAAFDFVVEYLAQDLYLYHHALRAHGGSR